MNVTAYKWLAVMLGIAVLILANDDWNLRQESMKYRFEIRAVENAVMDFKRMRQHLGQFPVSDEVEYLKDISHFKTRKANFSSYDAYLIFEEETDQMIRYVISDLRKKTGADLGDDPNAGIKKYGSEN